MRVIKDEKVTRFYETLGAATFFSTSMHLYKSRTIQALNSTHDCSSTALCYVDLKVHRSEMWPMDIMTNCIDLKLKDNVLPAKKILCAFWHLSYKH